MTPPSPARMALTTQSPGPGAAPRKPTTSRLAILRRSAASSAIAGRVDDGFPLGGRVTCAGGAGRPAVPGGPDAIGGDTWSEARVGSRDAPQAARPVAAAARP